MEVADPGHNYFCQVLDGPPNMKVHVLYVKRVGDKYPGNKNPHPGTTAQEVLRTVLDRLKYVNDQEASLDTQSAIRHVQDAIWVLERRAARRTKRTMPTKHDAVYGDICFKCGHTGCKGECHK